jgi:hypothetical protein
MLKVQSAFHPKLFPAIEKAEFNAFDMQYGKRRIVEKTYWKLLMENIWLMPRVCGVENAPPRTLTARCGTKPLERR